MEHLPDPGRVLAELRRVLKPGGVMFCTAPLFYEEHEQPYDFYRYTQFAWRHLMKEAAFEIVEVSWLEGYFGTLAYQLETASRYLPVRPGQISPGMVGYVAAPLMVLTKIACRVLAPILHRLDERHRYTGRGYPKNYVTLVRKPA
jgi:SAM-dependent methyltransferase